MCDYTVILTAYRRLHLLENQIGYIRNQTIEPKEIWVWKNYYSDNSPNFHIEDMDCDVFFDCNENFKYFGRFAAAQLAKTKYIAMFDDDTFPGENWIKNCYETYQKYSNSILGGVGVILNSPIYQNHIKVGWPSHNEDIIEVDLVGHAWFFEKNILKYFWTEEPLHWDTGEDIHLSYVTQKHGNIKTYCPPHPVNNKSMHSSLFPQLGVDDTTESVVNHTRFFTNRNFCVQEAIKRGWKTINNIKL